MGICEGDGLGIVEFTGGSPGTTVYLDDRGALDNGVWYYVESNGVWTARGPGVFADDVAAHNVQRGGASPLSPMDVEVCVDSLDLPPDGILLF